MKTLLCSKACALLCFVVLLTTGKNVQAQYCTPTYFQGCTLSSEINDFALNGDGGSAINDPATGCSTVSGFPPLTSYRDMSASMTVTLSAATSYTIATTTSALSVGTTGIQIFIDLNDDSAFDPSTESVGGGAYASLGGTTNITITIPSGAAPGSHRLRAVASGDATYPSIVPCPSYSLTGGGTSTLGEVHDYTVVIVGVTLSCGVPTGLAASSVTSTSAVLNWAEPTGSSGSEYVVSTSSVTPTGSGTAITALTYSASGLTPSTVYYAFVRDSCAPSNLSAWVSTTFTTTATSTTQAGNVAANEFSLTVYPNPVKEALNITINGTVNETANVTLMDVSGKVVKTVSANTNALTLNTTGLPAGVYILRYTDAVHTKTIRITKE